MTNIWMGNYIKIDMNSRIFCTRHNRCTDIPLTSLVSPWTPPSCLWLEYVGADQAMAMSLTCLLPRRAWDVGRGETPPALTTLAVTLSSLSLGRHFTHRNFHRVQTGGQTQCDAAPDAALPPPPTPHLQPGSHTSQADRVNFNDKSYSHTVLTQCLWAS